MNAIERVRAWLAERARFTPQQIEVMDALDGRVLAAEWAEYCKVRAQYAVWGIRDTPFKAFQVWHAAITGVYGGEMGFEMTKEGCRLANGEFYPYP